ncbi:MAG: GNAT family N-acetyltransferase [Candidatus Thiodiazotropha sp. (ex Lucinoma borealis)]|nr:GNAT family N-acetyltransferase [Candidatus Thiodiazotropha sp. (ex Lucinoma borealis)]MCU7868744.1 GNAT family N-acetyltransferase [Candidatus Thiodiazotropha sp. (ex Lucinoma borealis)]
MNTSNEYDIINADSSQYEGILDLIRSPEELFLIYPAATRPFDRTQLERLAEERSDFTVALDNEQVIGFANIYTNISGDKFFIGNVVISDAYRGQGIGRRLVCHMCNRIFEHYASTVHISVFTFNTPALLLYASLGFKPYDIEQRSMPNGNVTGLIHMRLNRKTW